MENQDTSSEQQLDQMRANRYRSLGNADGGKLIITNKRLIFEAHAINLNREPLEIPLSEIVSVTPFNAFIVPNGMKITMRDGTEHKFVINRRKTIMALIQNTLPKS